MQVSNERMRPGEGDRQTFGHPVRSFDEVDVEAEAPQLEIAREGTFKTESGRRHSTTDLGKPSPNSPPVKINPVALRVLEALSRDARENVNLMAASSEGPRHRLHVRSDSSAPGLGWVFPRDEDDAKRPVRVSHCVDGAHRCAAPSTTFGGIG